MPDGSRPRPAVGAHRRSGRAAGGASTPCPEAVGPRGLETAALLAGVPLAVLCARLVGELRLAAVVSPSIDTHAAALTAAIVAAAWWRAALRPLLAAAAVALAGLWLGVALTPLCGWLALGLERSDPLRSADAVYVLASSMRDDGRFTRTAQARLAHGFDLLDDGRAPRLVVSYTPTKPPHFASGARRRMERSGRRGELIVVGPARSTRQEAVAVARLFAERGWTRVLLVTSPLHSRRAAAAFEAAGLSVTSSPAAEVELETAWRAPRERRLRAFAKLAHEHLGWWVYRLRGWT